MTTHYLPNGRSESFACGVSSIGRRNERVQSDPVNTTCSQCWETPEYLIAVNQPVKGKYTNAVAEKVHRLALDGADRECGDIQHVGAYYWAVHEHDSEGGAQPPWKGCWLVREDGYGMVTATKMTHEGVEEFMDRWEKGMTEFMEAVEAKGP